MKTYTEEQVATLVRDALTSSKIQDALSLTYYAGSRLDAAEEIIRAAGITREEIDTHLSDPIQRHRLYPLVLKR